MSDTVVIYKSNYGSTKTYAEWIAEELSADLIEETKMRSGELKKYNNIIFGGGLYAGSINGINIITKNFKDIIDKNIIVFTCGLADPSKQENISNIHKSIDKLMSKEMQEKITFYHLRGMLDYKKLGMFHRMMMAMLKHMLLKKSKEELTEEDKRILDTYGQKQNFVDKSSIQPIIEKIKSCEN